MNGSITNIKQFATHDGPGIRTTVFFKGCPLKCVWCHNPEAIGFGPQVGFFEEKCVSCGACQEVCPQKALCGQASDKTLCVSCGLCESACASEALRYYGKAVTVEDVLEKVLTDRVFYETSGGGVTLSGGECLCQLEFCEALLQALKQEKIHTAVDTCGAVAQSALERVLPYTDLFLYDLKAIDEQTHIRCTGKDNRQILENLRFLDGRGANVVIRVPFVPGYNDGEMPKIRAFLGTLQHPYKVELLAYHNFAGSKYRALGMDNTQPSDLPTPEQLGQAEEELRIEKASL